MLLISYIWGISLKWQYFVIMACISLKWHKNGCSKEGNASSDGPKAEQIRERQTSWSGLEPKH